jgi:hypothetical protein
LVLKGENEVVLAAGALGQHVSSKQKFKNILRTSYLSHFEFFGSMGICDWSITKQSD